MYAVYILKEREDSPLVHYVGSTVAHMVDTRLRGHVRLARKGSSLPVARWIRSLSAPPFLGVIGLAPTARCTAYDSDDRNVRELEKRWIKALLRDGHPLTNQQHSGNGFRRPAQKAA